MTILDRSDALESIPRVDVSEAQERFEELADACHDDGAAFVITVDGKDAALLLPCEGDDER